MRCPICGEEVKISGLAPHDLPQCPHLVYAPYMGTADQWVRREIPEIKGEILPLPAEVTMLMRRDLQEIQGCFFGGEQDKEKFLARMIQYAIKAGMIPGRLSTHAGHILARWRDKL